MEASGLSVKTPGCNGDEAENLNKAVPTLPPEICKEIFGRLPPVDFQTVLNTCPNWNKLLASKKPSILFPKVLARMSPRFSRNDILACRLVNKACKASVDSVVPEVAQRIRLSQERKRLLQRIEALFEANPRVQERARLRHQDMVFRNIPFRGSINGVVNLNQHNMH